MKASPDPEALVLNQSIPSPLKPSFLSHQFVANVDDVRPQFNTSSDAYLSQSAIFNATLVRGLPGLPPTSANISALNGTLTTPMTAVDGMKQTAKPWYSDQILPFDITLAGASELGAATAMKIYGVEILNEGSGVSPKSHDRDAGDVRDLVLRYK